MKMVKMSSRFSFHFIQHIKFVLTTEKFDDKKYLFERGAKLPAVYTRSMSILRWSTCSFSVTSSHFFKFRPFLICWFLDAVNNNFISYWLAFKISQFCLRWCDVTCLNRLYHKVDFISLCVRFWNCQKSCLLIKWSVLLFEKIWSV